MRRVANRSEVAKMLKSQWFPELFSSFLERSDKNEVTSSNLVGPIQINVDSGKSHTIGIVGMGLMGRGIATCLLGCGYRVVAFSRPASSLIEARAQVASDIDDLIQHNAAPTSLRNEWPSRYR